MPLQRIQTARRGIISTDLAAMLENPKAMERLYKILDGKNADIELALQPERDNSNAISPPGPELQ